jgi:hypothetical protein
VIRIAQHPDARRVRTPWMVKNGAAVEKPVIASATPATSAYVHLIADHLSDHVLGTEAARCLRAQVSLAFGVRFVAIWMAAMGRFESCSQVLRTSDPVF